MNRTIFALLALSLTACSDDPPADSVDATQDPAADITADVDDSGADAEDAPEDSGSDAADDTEADSDTAEDGGLDAADTADTVDPLVDIWPEIPHSEPQADADPERWDPDGPAPDGQAAVGLVLAGGQPFTGPEARCRPGDLVIANAHVAACVAGMLAPSQYTYTGGYIIDLAPAAQRDGEMLEAIAPGADLRTVAAEVIEVLRDGSDGGAAVVRVTGTDVILAAIGNIVGDLFNGVPLRFETEYRLTPDATTIEAVTWVQGDDPELLRRRVDLGDLLLAGDHVTAWAPNHGNLEPLAQPVTPVWYGVAADFAYGVWSEEMTVSGLAPGLLDSDVDPTVMSAGVIGPESVAVYVRHYAVGRDTVALAEALAGVMPAGDATNVSLQGPVDEAHTERRYVIANGDGPVHVVRLDDDGRAAVPLADGDYTATWWGMEGDESATTQFTVPAAASVELNTPERGILRVWAETSDDGEAEPIPARVLLMGASGGQYFIERGSGVFAVAPGAYTVEVTRGEEWSVFIDPTVVVPAGGEAEVYATLTHELDTTGWVSGDMHQHSRRSIDSQTETTSLVQANLAAGLDFISPTDHDALENYARIVADMGADDLLHVFLGTEISPVAGHMNAFPMTYDPAQDGFGAVRLSNNVGRTIEARITPEMVTEARAKGAQIVQVNHPRDSSGVFDSSEYDPVLGPGDVDTNFWPGEFQSVEVVNGLGDTCVVLRDWFSLLNHGLRIAGVGNSDSHSVSRYPGWPRNYLHTGGDDPSTLTDTALVEAIQALAVSVSGGIFIDFSDGVLPGQVVRPNDEGEAAFNLRLQTPRWHSAQTLVVFANGVEIDRQDLSEVDAAEVVDFDEYLAFDVEVDTHFVFFAFSSGRQPYAASGSEIFGFSNPVFVDVDGDGWDAPGVPDEAAAPLPDLPFCR